MAIVNKELGDKIRNLRLEKGLTQEDAAHDAEIDYSFYNQIENGKRNPSIITLKKIARALGVSIKDLI